MEANTAAPPHSSGERTMIPKPLNNGMHAILAEGAAPKPYLCREFLSAQRAMPLMLAGLSNMLHKQVFMKRGHTRVLAVSFVGEPLMREFSVPGRNPPPPPKKRGRVI